MICLSLYKGESFIYFTKRILLQRLQPCDHSLIWETLSLVFSREGSHVRGRGNLQRGDTPLTKKSCSGEEAKVMWCTQSGHLVRL